MAAIGKPALPAAFLVLLTPFGVSAGYAAVTLSFLLAKSGMPTAAVAAIVAFSIWPQTWKVFWAPIVDTTLTAKAWFVIGAVLTGLSILALSVVPASVKTAPLLIVLVVVSSLASTLVSMSSEVFMAYGIEENRKGEVSGWSQAGNLGGTGIGGGIGVYLAQHLPQAWVSGAVLAILCIACCAALKLVEEPERSHRLAPAPKVARDLIKDVWDVARSRPGLLVLILMILPIGSGGAQGVWAAIATEWRAGADTVALVNGVLSGVASLVGAVGAGYLLDRMDRKVAYCLFGVALAVVAVVMAWLPRNPDVFVGCTLAYALVLGACYAGYSAAVLEAIGQGAAATKFNLLASVSNIPIAFMTTTDGQFHDRYGSNGMLYGEAGLAIVAIVGMALLVRLTRRWGPAAVPA